MSKPIYFSKSVVQRMCKIQDRLNVLDPDAAPYAQLVPGSPQPRQDVIVLPGSFNPPTGAHLALLKEAYLYTHPRHSFQLYAAFTIRTVDKESVECPLLLDRILLLQRVLRRLPQAGILLINRGLYVEQAEAIHTSFPVVRHIFFLMGYDKIVQIFDPHYYKDRDASLTHLFSLAQLLVVPRGDGDDKDVQALLKQSGNQQFAHFVHALPFSHIYRDLSSTRVRHDEPLMRSDIPREVKEFMRSTRAYAPPVPQSDGSQLDYYAQRMRYLNALLGSVR
jgi:nicotinic acid mononucleotide adenylyltransferase